MDREIYVVRAEGLEPSRTLRFNGFSYLYGFRRPWLFGPRFGVLDYPFTIPGYVPGFQVLPV
jgi:hypothetical protein